MLAYETALKSVLAATNTLGTEEILLAEALGRILAGAVKAKTNQPPFDGSAMDGYGVIAADMKPGTVLKQIGEAQAGD